MARFWLLEEKFSRVPIWKLPETVVWQPLGGAEDGAMPSGTACASEAAAKRSGPRKSEARIVESKAAR